eukprot:1680681-Rhodomonas_salina.1
MYQIDRHIVNKGHPSCMIGLQSQMFYGNTRRCDGPLASSTPRLMLTSTSAPGRTQSGLTNT